MKTSETPQMKMIQYQEVHDLVHMKSLFLHTAIENIQYFQNAKQEQSFVII